MARDCNFKIIKSETKFINDHGKGNQEQSGITVFYIEPVSVSRLIIQAKKFLSKTIILEQNLTKFGTLTNIDYKSRKIQ